MKKYLAILIIGTIISTTGCTTVLRNLGVNDWLSRDRRQADPTLQEMVIPKDLDPGTNNVVPFY